MTAMTVFTNSLRRLSSRTLPLTTDPALEKRQASSPTQPRLEIVLADANPVLLGQSGAASGKTISGQLLVHTIPSNTPTALTIPGEARISLVQTIKIKALSGVVKGIALPNYKIDGRPTLQRSANRQNTVVASVCLIDWKDASSTLMNSSSPDVAVQSSIDFKLAIPGGLPVTTETSIGSISYSIVATVAHDRGPDLHHATQICIERKIPKSCADDKITLVRRYPETGLISTLVGPAYIGPVGTFPFQLQLDETVLRGEQLTSFLRVNGLSWRVDEIVQIFSRSDEELRQKTPLADKNVVQTLTRRLNGGKCTNWIHGEYGQTKLVFEVILHRKAQAVCDVDPYNPISPEPFQSCFSSPRREFQKLGIAVSHKVVVELTGLLEVFMTGTGKREDSVPRRRRVCGAAYDIRIANIGIGEGAKVVTEPEFRQA